MNPRLHPSPPGHGVPRPTANGEIWLFNKSYTQYIPLSIFDLQAWTGSPSIYVFDCSSAGAIVNAYNQYAETRGPDASGAFADGCGEKPLETVLLHLHCVS